MFDHLLKSRRKIYIYLMVQLAETNAQLKADKKKLVKEIEKADDMVYVSELNYILCSCNFQVIAKIEKLCAQQCELERALEMVINN